MPALSPGSGGARRGAVPWIIREARGSAAAASSTTRSMTPHPPPQDDITPEDDRERRAREARERRRLRVRFWCEWAARARVRIGARRAAYK
jgi:hypothetical protein